MPQVQRNIPEKLRIKNIESQTSDDLLGTIRLPLGCDFNKLSGKLPKPNYDNKSLKKNLSMPGLPKRSLSKNVKNSLEGIKEVREEDLGKRIKAESSGHRSRQNSSHNLR